MRNNEIRGEIIDQNPNGGSRKPGRAALRCERPDGLQPVLIQFMYGPK
jgi:hypothetical protein